MRARMPVLFALSLLSACQEQPAKPAPDFTDANIAWNECRGEAMMKGVKGPKTPEALTEEAFVQCKALEEQFLQAGLAEQGEAFRSSFAKMREVLRQAMVERIGEIRSGKPPSNPFLAWGRCTGEKANAELGNPDPTPVRVERVLAACRDFEKAVRADAVSRFGEVEGNRAVDSVMPDVKQQLADRINAQQ